MSAPLTPRELETTPTNAKWFPSIDGLRALSVLFVLIHHYNAEYIGKWGLGNAGVVIFFCISGFLGYTVLDRDLNRFGAVSYEYYLRRRALRIWPLYFFVILIAIFISYPVSISSIAAQFLFSSNFQMAHWQQWPPGSLTQFWTIAVEEQFYIVAPLLFRAMRSRYRIIFVISVFVISNVLRILNILDEPHNGNGGVYYMTYTYADTFVAGMLLGQWRLGAELPAWLRLGQSRARDTIYMIFTIVILVITIRLLGVHVFPRHKGLVQTAIMYALLPAIGLTAVNIAVSPKADFWRVSRILGARLPRVLGVLSYGAYCIHLQLYELLEKIDPILGGKTHGLAENIFAISLVFVVAAILHRLVEQPFLAIKDHILPKSGIFNSLSSHDIPWITIISVGLVVSGLALSYARLPP